MPEEPLESHAWRVFRIFLSQLEDADLDTVYRQLHNERAARQERDHDAMRLLFSSLSGSDLEMAGEEILLEQRARIEDLQMLGRITAGETSAPTATNLNGAGAGNGGPAAGAARQARAAVQLSASQVQISLASGGHQRDECDDRGSGRGPKEKQTRMTAFTISDDNNITVFARAEEVAQAGDTAALVFDSKAALARISAEWPLTRLVDLYNSIAGHGKVQTFVNRSKAVTRIWEAIQPLARNTEASAAPQAKKRKSTKSGKPAHKNQSANSPKLAKGGGQRREGGGKKAAVIAMMKRTKGVTLAEITAATGWQKHTVRGFVSILASKGGEKIESTKNTTGERTYRIAK